ncbi:hypothetical protein ACFSMW_08355 [Virgibacillus halophilus]|uniref:Plasmid segregation centromere-binding protein ParR n=1 Tax=Tigheibacillus halophilus TaxID=361280 RepID=A0ABU5C534_9BACI|nr:hypothetical protein [Virgibacillus halophilus]
MSEIKRGQTISFRVPSDTPDHLLKHLDALKKQERRNFSSKIAEYVMNGLGQSYQRKRESITVPLPHQLSKAQRDWLKHEHSEALLGSIVYHILADPVRATSLLASMNSSALDIDEALYLQEEVLDDKPVVQEKPAAEKPVSSNKENSADMDSIDWEAAMKDQREAVEETAAASDEDNEADLDDLLGDFLSKMNK